MASAFEALGGRADALYVVPDHQQQPEPPQRPGARPAPDDARFPGVADAVGGRFQDPTRMPGASALPSQSSAGGIGRARTAKNATS